MWTATSKPRTLFRDIEQVPMLLSEHDITSCALKSAEHAEQLHPRCAATLGSPTIEPHSGIRNGMTMLRCFYRFPLPTGVCAAFCHQGRHGARQLQGRSLFDFDKPGRPDAAPHVLTTWTQSSLHPAWRSNSTSTVFRNANMIFQMRAVLGDV